MNRRDFFKACAAGIATCAAAQVSAAPVWGPSPVMEYWRQYRRQVEALADRMDPWRVFDPFTREWSRVYRDKITREELILNEHNAMAVEAWELASDRWSAAFEAALLPCVRPA